MLLPPLLLLSLQRSASGFEVLWNSPSPGCCGSFVEGVHQPKANPLPRFAHFNISGNQGNGSHYLTPCVSKPHFPCFNGNKVVQIYEPDIGLYPQYQMNSTTLEWYAVNGGLPQLANMTAHLAKWSLDLVSKIPDPAVSPIVGIDSTSPTVHICCITATEDDGRYCALKSALHLRQVRLGVCPGKATTHVQWVSQGRRSSKMSRLRSYKSSILTGHRTKYSPKQNDSGLQVPRTFGIRQLRRQRSCGRMRDLGIMIGTTVAPGAAPTPFTTSG